MVLDLIAYIALILILCFGLVRAADLVEDAFVLVAQKLGISAFVIGFVVLSAASSLPEISLLVSASAAQSPQLSMGNLLGGVIVLLTLAVSVNVIRSGDLPFRGRFGVSEVWLALIVLALPVVTLLDGSVNATEGLLLIVSYALLAIYITYRANRNRHLHQHATVEVGRLSRLLVRALVGLVSLLIISRLLVDAAVRTAEMLEVSNAVIGLLVLALGTNIPELTVSFRSMGKGKDAAKLAIGNLIGSATINTASFGLLALLSPFIVEDLPALAPSLIIFMTTLGLFGIAAWSDRKISRRESFILIGVYASLILTEVILVVVRS